MSIQNKKVILIQNEKDIHVHVLGNLGLFSYCKVLGYLTSTSVLIVSSITLTLPTKVINFLLGDIST